jgi:hypothetical protein
MPTYDPGTRPRRPENDAERLARWRREDEATAKSAWLERIGQAIAEFDQATAYAHHNRNRVSVPQIAEIMGWPGLLNVEQAKLTNEIFRAVNTRSPDAFEGIVADPAEDEFMAGVEALGIRSVR